MQLLLLFSILEVKCSAYWFDVFTTDGSTTLSQQKILVTQGCFVLHMNMTAHLVCQAISFSFSLEASLLPPRKKGKLEKLSKQMTSTYYKAANQLGPVWLFLFIQYAKKAKGVAVRHYSSGNNDLRFFFAVQNKINKTKTCNTAASDMIKTHHIGKAQPVYVFTMRCNCNAKLNCSSAASFMTFFVLSGVSISNKQDHVRSRIQKKKRQFKGWNY